MRQGIIATAILVFAALFTTCVAWARQKTNEDAQASAVEGEVERSTAWSLVESFGQTLGAANLTPPRAILPLGFAVIKHFEGWEPMPYDDPAGYCTVGYGHLLDLKRCAEISPLPYAAGLTREEGDTLLETDSQHARRAVQSLVTVELNEEQFSALTSFVFNIGRDKFSNSTLLRRLNEGEYEEVGRQLRRWIRAGGLPMNGLIRRRACEELLFKGDLELDASGGFDVSACVALGAASTVTDPIDVDLGE